METGIPQIFMRGSIPARPVPFRLMMNGVSCCHDPCIQNVRIGSVIEWQIHIWIRFDEILDATGQQRMTAQRGGPILNS